MASRSTPCYVFSTAPKIPKTWWDYFAFTMFVAVIQIFFEPFRTREILREVDLQLMLRDVV